MSNKALFASARPSIVRPSPANAVNEAGGAAYEYSAQHALAQYALTGTLNGTFYASDEDQMKKVLELAEACGPEFVAKTAVFARERGFMKDMPSFLLAWLAAHDTARMKQVFSRVVDSPKMIRNFVQMIRSGQLGRKSFGTAPKRMITDYLGQLSDDALFRADVGNSPTLQDIIKLVRPRPETKSRAALYGYLLDRKDASFLGEKIVIGDNLPAVVLAYEDFKARLRSATTDGEKDKIEVPNVPFLMLTALPITKAHWKTVASRATWQQLRMNLNTFARHGVFEDADLTKQLASKLANREEILRAKVFPYQLFAASQFASTDIPGILMAALSDAADIAIENIPTVDGVVAACLDISGSMQSAVTGSRGSATSKVSCLQIAALVGAALLRKNPSTILLPFSDDVVLPAAHGVQLNPRDPILTNAKKLASLPSGGTDCSAPLRYLVRNKITVDLVWFVSDNQSWVDDAGWAGYGQEATSTMVEFAKLKKQSPKVKMIRNDIQPNATTQVQGHRDVISFGGFSDRMFEVAANFAKPNSEADALVTAIQAIQL